MSQSPWKGLYFFSRHLKERGGKTTQQESRKLLAQGECACLHLVHPVIHWCIWSFVGKEGKEYANHMLILYTWSVGSPSLAIPLRHWIVRKHVKTQSLAVWNLSEREPDHPASCLFFPALTLTSLILLLWRQGREEQRTPPTHPVQILISLFPLNAPTISILCKAEFGGEGG